MGAEVFKALSTPSNDGVGPRTLSADNVQFHTRQNGGTHDGTEVIRKPGALDESRRKELEEKWRNEEDMLAKSEINSGLMVNSDERVQKLAERRDHINHVHESQVLAIQEEIETVKKRIEEAGEKARDADRTILDYYIRMLDELEIRHAQDVMFAVQTASKNYPQPVIERSFPGPSASGNSHSHPRSSTYSSVASSSSSSSSSSASSSSTPVHPSSSVTPTRQNVSIPSSVGTRRTVQLQPRRAGCDTQHQRSVVTLPLQQPVVSSQPPPSQPAPQPQEHIEPQQLFEFGIDTTPDPAPAFVVPPPAPLPDTMRPQQQQPLFGSPYMSEDTVRGILNGDVVPPSTVQPYGSSTLARMQ